MPNNEKYEIDDILLAPLEKILSRIGRGVAEAQRELDLNSIATQVMIDNEPALKEYGLQAPWYHMPETEVSLKLALNIKREDTIKNNKLAVRKLRMYGSPMNAAYKNNYNSDFSGSSTIRMKIVSIPPQKQNVE